MMRDIEWAAQSVAEDIPLQRRLGRLSFRGRDLLVGKPVVRIQDVIADEFVGRAVKILRAAFGHHLDQGSGMLADVCAVV